MIPFTIPTNHEVINISTVSRMYENEDGTISVIFVDGAEVNYQSKCAEIVKAEIMFHFSQYQEIKKEINSKIITGANGKRPLF
jgi:hypothetical protein